MKMFARFLHLALCLMVIFAINSNTAFSNEFCFEESAQEEQRGELGQQVVINDILAPLKLLTGPLLIQNIDLSLPTSESFISDDQLSFRTSGTSPPLF